MPRIHFPRFNFRSRNGLLILAACVVAVVLSLFQWNRHRTIPLEDALNLAYWWRRAHGQDLYSHKDGILHHGNRDLPEIALTIDDGPHADVCPRMLDTLKTLGVPATFFVVGEKVKERPELVRRMLDEGHEVANHTQTHLRLTKLRPDQVRKEIDHCTTNVERASGQSVRLMRPPGVKYDQEVLNALGERNMVLVDWTCAAEDYNDVTPDFIVDRVTSRVGNGSIVLLHQDRMATVEALPRIVSTLRQRGYRFVSVSEMLNHLPKPVQIVVNPVVGNLPTASGRKPK